MQKVLTQYPPPKKKITKPKKQVELGKKIAKKKKKDSLYNTSPTTIDLLTELDRGSGPNFEAKKHAGQTVASKMASIMCFHWAQKAFFPWAHCERDIYNS